jgi:PleD family two-component response regulator
MMMTTSANADERNAGTGALTQAVQNVVIVNGTAAILDMVETALDAGHYDVVFVENSRHAYSQIKRVQPNLVILCLHVDDLDGFQVLSMLKLDEETRSIPVLTYTTQHEPASEEEETSETSDSDNDTIFVGGKPPAMLMN